MKNLFEHNMQIWVSMNDRLNESIDNKDVNEELKDVNPITEDWDAANADGNEHVRQEAKLDDEIDYSPLMEDDDLLK